MTFALLLYCYSGARIGTFIPDSSKAQERGLRYEVLNTFASFVQSWGALTVIIGY